MKIDTLDISMLLPQRRPFVFVDKLIHFQEEDYSCRTAFEVTSQSLLLEKNMLSEAGLLENMAQSCALQIGYLNHYILKKPIQVGFIGAVKNVKIDELPQVGDKIETSLHIVAEFAEMKIAQVRVFRDTQCLAEGELKIALQ